MKIKKLLFALLAVTALAGCKQEEPVVEPVLEVSSTELRFAAVSDEKVIYITANNDWSLVADVDWLSFNQESGEAAQEQQMVKVYADDNTVEEARSGKITITSDKLIKTVNVTQAAVEPEPVVPAELTLSVSTLTAVAAGEELTFTVTSNKAWQAEVDAGWVTLQPAAGDASEEAVTVKAVVAANESYEERAAVVTVTAEDVQKTVAITQAAAEQPEEPEEMLGAGTEADPYQIKTAEHFVQMRELAVLGGETWFNMVADIDMSGVENYIPVNFDEGFLRKIHFDGGGFTLSNFYCNKQNSDFNYPSIFGVLYGTCKNLNVDKATIVSTSGCGVIGAYVGTTGLPGSVENVTITNSSVTNDGDRCGGVCGTAKEATFKNVSFQGTVTSNYTGEAKSGGFVGQTETTATFEDCSVDVVFTGKGTDTGGFAGKLLNNAAFTGCKVKVTITSAAATKNRCGGFVGWNSSASAIFTDCHVLKGSSVKDMSGRAEANNGNFGGFIGFGDTKGAVLEVTDCSAEVDVDGGLSTYNSCFISYLGYASTTTITNCYAAGTVKTHGGNQTGGLLGSMDKNAVVTITNCHFSGLVDAEASYVGGIVGGVSGKLTLSQTYSTGEVKAVGAYVGGLIGASMNDGVTVTHCFSTARVTAFGQQVGGLVGTTTNKLVMSDCFAAGDVYSATSGAAGIVGRVQKSSSITNCIAWNRNVASSRSANNVYASGAILGCAQEAGTYKGCYRRYDMVYADDFMTLVDHEDCENATPPLPSYSTATHQQAYHGKAAAADATLASVAKSLGWDEAVWDFSSSSDLGLSIKQLGDNKIEF